MVFYFLFLVKTLVIIKCQTLLWFFSIAPEVSQTGVCSELKREGFLAKKDMALSLTHLQIMRLMHSVSLTFSIACSLKV
jgi:predicted Kef-type K+ transport protein